MSKILITGANRGMGLGLVKKLLTLGNQPNIIMACRDLDKGKAAIDSLAKENLDVKSLELVKIDMTNPESFASVGEYLRGNNAHLDMVVNNAAINIFDNNDNFSADKAQKTLTCNLFNQVKLIDLLLDSDAINQNGKIINYTSTVGTLRTIENAEVKARLQKASTVQEAIALGNEYIEALKAGQIWQRKNTMVPEYGFSKLLFSIYTEILGKDPRVQQKNIKVNAFCPGWVRTSMGGPSAPSSVEDASEMLMSLLNQMESGNQEIQGKVFATKRFIDIR